MARRIKPYLLHATFRPDLEFDFDSYPFNIPAVRELGNISFHPNVTFFVGENGSGKSTVLEAIAVALGFGPEGGTKNVQFRTVESVSPLHDALRIARGVPQPKDTEHYAVTHDFLNNYPRRLEQLLSGDEDV
jgi:predicted ATPase